MISATAIADGFVRRLEADARKANRFLELRAWFERLEPRCGTCLKWMQASCPARRRPFEMEPCEDHEELPEIRQERALMQAAFETYRRKEH